QYPQKLKLLLNLPLHYQILKNMLRSHHCGALRLDNVNEKVVLAGWVQKTRDKGGVIWVDLRDRYGLTHLIFEEGKTTPQVMEIARSLGRELVVKAFGTVAERYS